MACSCHTCELVWWLRLRHRLSLPLRWLLSSACAFFGICISALFGKCSCSSICGLINLATLRFGMPMEQNRKELISCSMSNENVSLSINPFYIHACACECVCKIELYRYTCLRWPPLASPAPQGTRCCYAMCEFHFYFFVSFSIGVKCGVRYTSDIFSSLLRSVNTLLFEFDVCYVFNIFKNVNISIHKAHIHAHLIFTFKCMEGTTQTHTFVFSSAFIQIILQYILLRELFNFVHACELS